MENTKWEKNAKMQEKTNEDNDGNGKGWKFAEKNKPVHAERGKLLSKSDRKQEEEKAEAVEMEKEINTWQQEMEDEETREMTMKRKLMKKKKKKNGP